MSFDTTTFLFLFLPGVIIAYMLAAWGERWTQKKASTTGRTTVARNAVLLVASLLFYAWGEPICVLLLIASSMVAWGAGILMHRWQGQLAARIVMVVTVVLLLTSLGAFKYLGFLLFNLNRIPSIDLPMVDLRLPIGISFFTFQILSYVFDLYRGNISVQRNPMRLLLYVSLFPQLIAGPIVRYSTVETELTQRTSTSTDIYEGSLRFIRGLAKKIIIADNVARFSEAVYSVHFNSQEDALVYPSVGTTALWVAALAYTLQLYFDFSGYSDMAIGLGRIFGFHFLENFNFPYVSRSITEFWRRWHISLSGWFRDYVYIPLGGNRHGLHRQLLNIMVVWMLTGLWHGAAWNFILWGLYYGGLLLIEKIWRSSSSRRKVHESLHLPYLEDTETSDNKVLCGVMNGLHWFVTFVIVNIGWVMFHICVLSNLLNVLKAMFQWRETDWLRLIATNSDAYLALPYIVLGLIFAFPLFRFVGNSQNVVMQTLRPILAIAAFLLCLVYIYSFSFHPFIYFRF